MGNGNLGVSVWGDERLHLTVNRADFWDHRGGELLQPPTTYAGLVEAAASQSNEVMGEEFACEKFPDDVFKPQRLPVGRFEFILAPDTELATATLDYATGDLFIRSKDGRLITVRLSATKNVVFIQDESTCLKNVDPCPAWTFEKSQEWLEQYGFSRPEYIGTETLSGWVQSCPDDPALVSLCLMRGEGFILSLELGDTPEQAQAAAEATLKEAERTGAEALLAENKIYWDNFWRDTPTLNLPDEFYKRFYKYALYKFACATSPESTTPSGLQGPWVEEYQRAQWSADYHFNVNIQQIYTLAFATGKVQHLLPLFAMLETAVFRENMRHNARVLFGIEDGLLLTHAVDDRGFQCGWIMCGSTLDPACGGWTAQLFWLYYKYTGDEEFLRERAYPFLCGVMRVFEEMLAASEDGYSIPFAISAEYGSSCKPDGLRGGRDPSYQLACAHMLLDALLESCEILAIEPRPVWLDLKKNLPPYTVFAEDSSPRIAIWEGQDLAECHRHHSHLACIYPFDTLGEQRTNETEEIINNSLSHWVATGMGKWSEWCFPWAAIIQARSGLRESPLQLLNIWREIFINEGLATVYLPRFFGISAHRRADIEKPKEDSEIMQLDGTMAGATALLEMLAHTHAGVTSIFAGVPAKWSEVSFADIHLPGPFIVSAKKQAGEVVEVRVRSRGGRAITLAVAGCREMRLRKNNEETRCTLPLRLTLARDEEIVLLSVND